MSMRYPGGFIASTPVTANYPSGVWTQAQAIPYQAQNVWTRDQFWPYTTLLLQGDGAVNGAQNNTFLDSSSNNFTITRNGNTTQGAFTPYEQDGYWSNYFAGSQSLSNGTNVTASGDFTLECWVNLSSYSAARIFFAVGNETANRRAFFIDSSGVIKIDLASVGATSLGGSVPINTWTHIAITRSSNTVTAYVNGVATGTTATISGTFGNGNGFYIGSVSDNSNSMVGYISNLRWVLGSVVYTAAFTPPVTPLTAVTNTSILSCQSNRFRDNSANAYALTVNGSPSVQAFQPFPGATTWSASVLGGSGYFDGTGDYLTVADNAALEVGAGDFTAEAWFYPTSLAASYSFVFGKWTSANTDRSFGVFVTNTGSVEAYWTRAGGIDNFVATATGLVIANAWNHIAFVRNGNVFTVYVNGASSGSKTDAITVYDSSVAYSEGAESGGTYPITGYLASARLVKGTAVYTAAFTPPTAPLTAITNTSLLLNMTNAGIYDNSMMNDLETVGNAQVSTSVVKYGTGSMAFDGNGDYLLPPSSPNLAFGTGDCTIEFWYYANSSQGTRTILVGNNLGFTTNAWNIQINNTSPSITNKLQLWAYNLNSSAVAIQGNTTLVANNWYHVALVRNGSTFTFYLNGVSEGTTTSSASLDGGGSKTISIARDGTDYFNGYIDDLRITKAARYITNFTPPPARLPAQ